MAATVAALVVLLALPGLLSRRAGTVGARVAALLALLALAYGTLNQRAVSIVCCKGKVGDVRVIWCQSCVVGSQP